MENIENKLEDNQMGFRPKISTTDNIFIVRQIFEKSYEHNCYTITSRSATDKNTKHTQMIYTCGHILRNNTNSTNANQREEY